MTRHNRRRAPDIRSMDFRADSIGSARDGAEESMATRFYIQIHGKNGAEGGFASAIGLEFTPRGPSTPGF